MILPNKSGQIKVIALQLLHTVLICNNLVNRDYYKSSLCASLDGLFLIMLLHQTSKHIAMLFAKPVNITQTIEQSRQAIIYFQADQHKLKQQLRRVKPLATLTSNWQCQLSNETHIEIDSNKPVVSNLYRDMAILCNQLQNNTEAAAIIEPIKLSQAKTNWLPFAYNSQDFHSKFRLYDSLGIVATLKLLTDTSILAKPLAEFDHTYYALAAIGIMLLTAAMVHYESKLLRQQQFDLACMGFQRRVQPYNATIPTCIGQQLTAQWLFVGANRTLVNTANEIMKFEQVIPRLRACVSIPQPQQQTITLLAERIAKLKVTKPTKQSHRQQIDPAPPAFANNLSQPSQPNRDKQWPGLRA